MMRKAMYKNTDISRVYLQTEYFDLATGVCITSEKYDNRESGCRCVVEGRESGTL
jgi:hypothetical protein